MDLERETAQSLRAPAVLIVDLGSVPRTQDRRLKPPVPGNPPPSFGLSGNLHACGIQAFTQAEGPREP